MPTAAKLARDSPLVADEAWCALALLHHEQSTQNSFTAKEILDRARAERITAVFRPGVQAHIYLHNVANLEPNSARYRMFYKLPDDTYRLFRPGDQAHPSRKGKMKPAREQLPEKYHYLLDWYANEYCSKETPMKEDDDPILKMRGLGKEIWAGTDSDEYVRDLRRDWYADQPDSK